MIEDEDLLLAVLNSAPVVDGVPVDQLDGATGAELLLRSGGTGTDRERLHVRHVRDALHGVIRGEADSVERLAATLERTALLPVVSDGGLEWRLDAPADDWLGSRVAVAWSRVMEQLPGRLRACANAECHLFLIDHSRPGTAKWCSMATCGNRMKARAHQRRRSASA